MPKRIAFFLFLLLGMMPLHAQQPAVADPVTDTAAGHRAAVDAAVAEARTKNRQYWKTVKLVTLGSLAAALVLMQLRGRKRRQP